MSVSNLTNTIWVIKSEPTLDHSQIYDITFTSAGSTFNSFTVDDDNRHLSGSVVEGIGYGSTVTYEGYKYISGQGTWVNQWVSQAYRIIKITGGTDVTNSTLISWLEANATLVPVVDLSETTWQFRGNGEININQGTNLTYNLNFSSNNSNFTSLSYENLWDSDFDEYRTEIIYGNYAYYFRDEWEDNAYKTISITNGTDIANPDLIAWLSQNATYQSQPVIPTKTFDLSTLQLSAGTHTIQVKARASGYRDSEFSNSVSYVVAPPTFNNVRIQIKNKGFADVGYRINGGEWVFAYNRDYTDNTYNNVTKVEIALPDTGGVDNIDIFASNSTLIQSINEPDSPASNPLDITEYLQDGCNIEIWADD